MWFKIVVTDECNGIFGQENELLLKALDCVKESEVLFANSDEELEILTDTFLRMECISFIKPEIEFIYY